MSELGRILSGLEKRDAIHVAIIPVQASVDLKPGQTVNARGEPTGREVGIVDPFLRGTVRAGQWFYLCLYPGTVQSIRHNWSHPAFEDEAGGSISAVTDEQKAAARESLDSLAKEYFREMTGELLIEALKRYVETDWPFICEGYDTPSLSNHEIDQMWRNFEIVTGRIVENREERPFSCTC